MQTSSSSSGSILTVGGGERGDIIANPHDMLRSSSVFLRCSQHRRVLENRDLCRIVSSFVPATVLSEEQQDCNDDDDDDDDIDDDDDNDNDGDDD